MKKVAVKKITTRPKNFCNSQVYKCGAIAAWKPRQKCSAWDFEFYASKTRYQNVHGSTSGVLDKELAFDIILSQATSNKQQATSNKQQATSNKQQATSGIIYIYWKTPNIMISQNIIFSQMRICGALTKIICGVPKI